MRRAARILALLLLLALAALPAAVATGAGAPTPAPAAAPRTCAYCRMLLQYPEYGGEIRTTSGRRLTYDAIECMAAAVLTDSVPPATIRSMTVTDFDPPHRRLAAAGAVFFASRSLTSPMGLGLSAHASRARADAVRARHPGERLDWAGVVARVNAVWFQGALDAPRHSRLPRGSR